MRRAREWAEQHPERSRQMAIQSYHRRRANKLRTAVGPVSLQRIIERDHWQCHICGQSITPGDHHFDHVIPLARGGAHTEDNIKLAHANCNLRKSDRLMEELHRG